MLARNLCFLNILIAGFLFVIFYPTVAAADNINGLSKLTASHTHFIMRHAIAPGTGDPDNFKINDCSTQRNLNAAGRNQAEKIGTLVSGYLKSPVEVYSSQWCRCKDTARLLDLGPVKQLPFMNSVWQQGDDVVNQKTNALKQFLVDLPPDQTVILVTHYANIVALTGIGVGSGDGLIIQVMNDDEVKVIDQINF